MKLIEELDLVNLPDICRYLAGEMTVRECRIFERRLREDQSLKTDYDLVKKEVLDSYKASGTNHINDMDDHNPKRRLGEVLKNKGFLIGLMALVMGLTAIGVTFLFQLF